MATRVSDVMDGLTASLSENKDSSAVILDGYGVEIITGCQNDNCENDFPSPVVVMSDEDSKSHRFLVCPDCAAAIDNFDDDDNEDEVEDEIADNDLSID